MHAVKPLIGITTDVSEQPKGPRAELSLAYARRVAEAGGLPVLLPPIAALAHDHARLCSAVVFSGGADVRMDSFGSKTHPQANPVHADRQAYELALLDALREAAPATPVLGICLGMQLMAMHAGGVLNQHMPETIATADRHKNADHPIIPDAEPCPLILVPGPVASNHHQAITDPGGLAVAARADDGVIEAVTDRLRPFYVGVQWHPERTANPELGVNLFTQLIRRAAR